MLKKAMNSQGMIVVGSEDDRYKFPPGFAYRIEGITYTVKENVTKEAKSQMRMISTSDGRTEITPIESIQKDIDSPQCQILAQGQLPPAAKTGEAKPEEKKEAKVEEEDKKE